MPPRGSWTVPPRVIIYITGVVRNFLAYSIPFDRGKLPIRLTLGSLNRSRKSEYPISDFSIQRLDGKIGTTVTNLDRTGDRTDVGVAPRGGFPVGGNRFRLLHLIGPERSGKVG